LLKLVEEHLLQVLQSALFLHKWLKLFNNLRPKHPCHYTDVEDTFWYFVFWIDGIYEYCFV